MQKVVVLGALSAIAEAVERRMAERQKELLLVGRSAERLEALRQDLLIRGASSVLTFAADLDDVSQHRRLFDFAQQHFPGFDTLLLAYGSMLDQAQCQHSVECAVGQLHTGFVSAAAILTLFADDFEARGGGCIAVITSVAGDRGRASNYVYGAAKAGLSHFLEGLRARLHPAGVRVINIKPGPVDTPMTAHLPRNRPFASPGRVGNDIYRALEARRPGVLYTPSYWRWMMLCLRAIPGPIFKRLRGL